MSQKTVFFRVFYFMFLFEFLSRLPSMIYNLQAEINPLLACVCSFYQSALAQ